MQLRQLNLRACPSEVLARIKALHEDQRLRRRAILIRSADETEWRTTLITLEAFSSEAKTPELAASVSFDDLVLDESWLRPSEVIDFLTALNDGAVEIGPSRVKLHDPQHWSLECLTSNNNTMSEAGIAAQGKLQFEKTFAYGIYLNQSGNYFPTLDDAIRHWAPFAPCHGAQDGRLGEIILLLPETRARFDIVNVKENSLHIELAGETLKDGGTYIISAICCGEEITNRRHAVDRASIEIQIPPPYDWWDLALCTNEGELLDKWSSRDFMRIEGKTITDQSPLEALVRQALETGEGQRVEFKPFVDLPRKKKDTCTKKADLEKFSEVARTAVAMANAGGGHIFIGVTDECALSRDYSKITKWGEGELSTDLIDAYRRAMLTCLNDRIVTDAPLTVKHVVSDDANALLIEIPPVQHTAAEVVGDTNYYMRRGASNTRLSPSEWSAAKKTNPFST
jgi:schlafen family protein